MFLRKVEKISKVVCTTKIVELKKRKVYGYRRKVSKNSRQYKFGEGVVNLSTPIGVTEELGLIFRQSSGLGKGRGYYCVGRKVEVNTTTNSDDFVGAVWVGKGYYSHEFRQFSLELEWEGER